MSEMTARERIHQEVYEAYQAGIDHECAPHKYPPMKQADIAEIADDILAIVRQALLSDSAVERVAKGGGGYSDEEWEDLLWHRKDRQLQEARSVAERVFDAAFGPGKTLDTDRV